MASKSFTPAERDALTGLLGLYERERMMYAEILELTRRQVAAVRAGNDLQDIRGMFERKRTMLDMIASMETGYEDAKATWERLRFDGDDTLCLGIRASLRHLGELIEDVLRLEGETDRLFMAAATV